MKSLLSWLKAHKVISALAVVVIIIIAIASSGGSKTPSTTSSKTTTNKTASRTISDPHTSYTVAEDKNTYVAVVVPTAYDNTATMKELGDTLLYDYNYLAPNRTHVFVYVFDNAQAASYLDTVLSGNDTAAQDSVYDPHFVAEYQRNDSSHLNQFIIQLNGGDKDPNPMTINY